MSKINDNVYYVSPNDEQLKASKVQRQPDNDLNKDAFMQLLVTQLRYQDPLNPMDNEAFMAQMAQFSSLEQMMNMNNTMNRASAHGLLGKVIEATYRNPASNQIEEVLGKVDSVVSKNGNNFLLVNGKEISMDDVLSVIDPGLINDSDINSGFELIGKTVQATMFDKKLDLDIVYEGEVNQIVMIDGDPYVTMGSGDKAIQIPVDNVNNVIEKPTITGKLATGTYMNGDGEKIDFKGLVDYILVIDGEINVSIDGVVIPFDNIETVSKG